MIRLYWFKAFLRVFKCRVFIQVLSNNEDFDELPLVSFTFRVMMLVAYRIYAEFTIYIEDSKCETTASKQN